jgi:hypothetical protein
MDKPIMTALQAIELLRDDISPFILSQFDKRLPMCVINDYEIALEVLTTAVLELELYKIKEKIL